MQASEQLDVIQNEFMEEIDAHAGADGQHGKHIHERRKIDIGNTAATRALYSPSRFNLHVRTRLTCFLQYGQVGMPKYCINEVPFFYSPLACGLSAMPPISARERFKSVAGAICVIYTRSPPI